MEAKLFEVRARATLIPVIAIKLKPINSQENWLLGHEGFGLSVETQSTYVMLGRLDGAPSPFTYNVGDHPEEELRIAHSYIAEHFDELPSGAVIDTDYIRGRTATPVESDRYFFQKEAQNLPK